MNRADIGSYILLLAHQWDSGFAPNDMKEAAKIGKCTPSQVTPIIESKFPMWDDGKRRNQRLERERAKAIAFSEKQSAKGQAGAKKRWEKDGPGYAPAMPVPIPKDGNPFSVSGSLAATHTYPSLDEVKTECGLRCFPEQQGEDFWNHFESSGWIDKNSHPVQKWRNRLAKWVSDSRSKESERRHHAGGYSKPLGKSIIEQDIEAEQRRTARVLAPQVDQAAEDRAFEDKAANTFKNMKSIPRT